MLFFKLLFRTFLYLLCTLLIAAIAVIIKFLSIVIGDTLVYPIPLLGDALLSIEILEILNILVFAILGMGFGLATILIPRYFATRISALVLLFLVPLIFMSSSVFRYYNWVSQFASKENILYSHSQRMTNSFLRKVNNGKEGFLGFYLYTAKFPIIPTTEREIILLDELEKKSKSRFTQVTGVKRELVSELFASRGWAIRIVYLVISIFSTTLHYKKGIRRVRRT